MMSALDDLVKSLQAAAGSVEGTQSDVAQADSSAGEAVQSAALATAKQELDELLQRAAALQGGN